MELKLGRFSIALGEKPPKSTMTEVGATGTVIFDGILSETGEYLAEFRPGESQRKIIEKMRRSDGQVKAGLLALTLPLTSAHWDIAPASSDPQDLEVAAFVRANLFGGMSITWDDFLRHVLMMLPFGFSVFEKVWVLEDGKYKWKKLAPRLPQTIQRWYADDAGDLTEIEQWVWKGTSYTQLKIPESKIIVFTHEKEGSNFEGISCLRAAYKHWFYKNTLYAIDGIAAERHGIGVAYFTFPKTATDAQRKSIERIGESLHAHERAYVALPEGMSFDLKGVAGQLHDIKGSIEHHDVQILRSILAQFIALGAGGVGSYAMSEDQSGFFLMALKATGKNVCDTMGPAIKQLVDYNFSVKAYPKLTVSDLNYIDVQKLSTALNSLSQGGFVQADEGIEDEVRRLMHLPPRKGEYAKAEKQTPPSQPALKLAEEVAKVGREMTDLEKCVEFTEIENKLNTAEAHLVDVASKVQDRQIKRLVQMAVDDVAKGDMDKLAAIDVPYRDEMASAIEDTLLNLYAYGKEQVVKEAQKQGVKDVTIQAAEPTKDFRTLIRMRALAMSGVLASKLKSALAWEALNQMQSGELNRASLVGAMTVLSTKDLASAASTSISESLNMGRQAQAEAMADQITRVTSSAILDKNTCQFCEGMDGQYWDPGDEPTTEPPYSSCHGRDKCRCIWVYKFSNEVKR